MWGRETNMDERRQLPRWKINKEVKAWFPGTSDFSHCVIQDINLKGMGVSFHKPLALQGPMSMSFALEDSSCPIKIEAQIPWAMKGQGSYVYGLLFTKIDDEDKDRVYQYINANCYDQMRKHWWKE
jgi:hypothetical protein